MATTDPGDAVSTVSSAIFTIWKFNSLRTTEKNSPPPPKKKKKHKEKAKKTSTHFFLTCLLCHYIHPLSCSTLNSDGGFTLKQL
jgi:hypothetical protein